MQSKSSRPSRRTLTAAETYVKAEFSVIPVATNGSKAPAAHLLRNKSGHAKWIQYQQRRPTAAELKQWFGNGKPAGVAIVGGKVSKGLVIMDFDCRESFDTWHNVVSQIRPKLLDRLPIVATPSGGRHVYFRTSIGIRNKKLASARSGDGKKKTLIELKSEGGYCIAPGSPKECHDSGNEYQHLCGPPLSKVPQISSDEVDFMIYAACSLDQYPAFHTDPAPSRGHNKPGDVFNREADWSDILVPHGWKVVKRIDEITYWRRPGKKIGLSATTGYCTGEQSGDLLYVFSSNATPFGERTAYTKFAAKTLLEFEGDYSKCTKALLRERASSATDANAPPVIDLSSVKPIPFEAGLKIFQKWLVDIDIDALSLVLGIVAANSLSGDPVFFFLVGPPSSGKTELVRCLLGHPATEHLSTVTPSSLISGYISDGTESSLIPRLDGRTLVIKDFTPVLEMHREKRGEIFSILRDAYDGHCSKSFGTGETKHFNSHFNIIAAVTREIDRHSESMQSLGERFLRLNATVGNDRIRIEKSLRNANNEPKMRRELTNAACGILKSAATNAPVISTNIEKRIIDLAQLLAVCRTAVSRDYSKEIRYPPQAEGGGRVVKQMIRLAQGLAMVQKRPEISDDELRVLTRIALDSLPWKRTAVLRLLSQTKKSIPLKELGERTKLPLSSIRLVVEDLEMLQVVRTKNVKEGKTRVKHVLLQLAFREMISSIGGLG